MPKFYGQNKKRIDPRYFMDEKIEEAVIEPGLTQAGQWPGVSPADRVKKLAAQGMERQISGEIPPWESQDEEESGGTNLGLFDGTMEDGTPVAAVIKSVRKQLNIPGGTAILQKFDQLLKELGMVLGEPPGSADHEGFDPDADEMEDSLERTQASLSDKQRDRASMSDEQFGRDRNWPPGYEEYS